MVLRAAVGRGSVPMESKQWFKGRKIGENLTTAAFKVTPAAAHTRCLGGMLVWSQGLRGGPWPRPPGALRRGPGEPMRPYGACWFGEGLSGWGSAGQAGSCCGPSSSFSTLLPWERMGWKGG